MSLVLITGGGGFLGAWVVRTLVADGHSVRVLDRSSDRAMLRAIAGEFADTVEWETADVTSTANVRQAAEGCDFIIHLAALLTPACKDDPLLGARVNLIGTLNVFEAAKAHGITRIAYASSAAVFGPDDGATPHPVTQYGAFKLACEGCARAYWLDAGIASIGLRPTIVYGPGRESGLTADATLACREAAAGRPFTVGFSGRQDFIYVGDVAAAFAAAATRRYTGAHAFSLLGGTVDVTELTATIRAHLPQAQIAVAGPEVPMASDIAATPFSTLLGPMPQTSLHDGIAQTVAFYSSQRAA